MLVYPALRDRRNSTSAWVVHTFSLAVVLLSKQAILPSLYRKTRIKETGSRRINLFQSQVTTQKLKLSSIYISHINLVGNTVKQPKEDNRNLEPLKLNEEN